MNRPVFLLLVAALFCAGLYAQDAEGSDAQAAQQYVLWAQKEINNGNKTQALAGLKRAADFAKVSSDISYLLAVALDLNFSDRIEINKSLDRAIETNRWVFYSENDALLLKAQQLIAMREYQGALVCLERTAESADAAMLRLKALRGSFLRALRVPPSVVNSSSSPPLSTDIEALARFRSLLLAAMDRYPRDPRPLRIFFEYALGRTPVPSELPSGDINLLELALRRLPFLLESDPDLAWMASQFMRNIEDAKRYVSAYRAGGLFQTQVEDFRPVPASIPITLNLGLIDDTTAIEELFYDSLAGKELVIYKDLIISVYNLLRSEEGRDLLTRKLLSFSGVIVSDDDGDGFADTRTRYSSGVINEFSLDRDQNGVYDLVIAFSPDGMPVRTNYLVIGENLAAFIEWERYPSVKQAKMAEEVFLFRPADFQYAPVSFIDLGGSKNHAGLAYPVLSYQYINITRRTLVSFCSSLTRASAEFDGASEQIFLQRGIPLRSEHSLNEKLVSTIEFENGLPVVQYLDLDFDDRMETIRRFRRPGPDWVWRDVDLTFNYRVLIESTQSDWTGEGRFKTGEAYQKDGSVVYSWDMDGSGEMNYSETGKEQ